MVFEFMEFGDLTDILRRNDPTVEASSRTVELKNVSGRNSPAEYSQHKKCFRC